MKKKMTPSAVPEEVVVEWRLDKRGKLTVSCNGRMPDYSGRDNAVPPWHDVKDEIKSVCLKEGITEVGGKAFEGCKNLRKVMIPWSLRRLHYDCFKNCTKLEQIVTVREAEYRFSGEGFSLKSANQKTAVEMQAQKTQEIVFGLNSLYAVPWAAQKWGDCYVKKDVLYACFSDCPRMEVPEGVRVIHTFAFMDTNVEELTLPKSLVSIESFALANTKIREIMIPQNVEQIGEYAFADSKIKKVFFDNSKADRVSASVAAKNAFERTAIPAAVVRTKRLPEAFKVDFGTANKVYDYYKKLCIKEKTLNVPNVSYTSEQAETSCEADDKVVYGRISLDAENSIYRRLQRGSAIFKIRYDHEQKKVREVSSWHMDPFWYMYAEYKTEPYYGTDGQLELKCTQMIYFERKATLKEDFSIQSVFREWDGEKMIRRVNEQEAEEWFWSAAYYGDWGEPEKDLLERWMTIHSDYTI